MADRNKVRIIVEGQDATAPTFKGVAANAEQLGRRISGIFRTIVAGAAAITVGHFLKESVQEARDAEAIWSRLGVAVTNVGVPFARVRGELEGFARQLQATTRFSDENYAESLGTLLGLTGDYEKSLRAVNVAAGLAAKHQIDINAASVLVGKAINGQTETLARYGIQLDKSKDSLTQLEVATRGYAEQSGQGMVGLLARLSNGWNNVKEAIGNALLGTTDMGTGSDGLVTALTRLETWISENSGNIQAFVQMLIDGAAKLGELVALIPMIRSPQLITAQPEIARLGGIQDPKVLEREIGRLDQAMTELDQRRVAQEALIGRFEAAWSPNNKKLREMEAELAGLDAARDFAQQRLTALQHPAAPITPNKPPPPLESPTEKAAREKREHDQANRRFDILHVGEFGVIGASPETQKVLDEQRQAQEEQPIEARRRAQLHGGLAELPATFDAIQEPAQAMESTLDRIRQQLEDLGITGQEMGAALGTSFVDAVAGAHSLEEATIGAAGKAVKGAAQWFAKDQFAKAAAAFAEGLWPPNPTALAAGAKHLVAASLFQAIAGGGGGSGSSRGGGGGGLSRPDLARDRGDFRDSNMGKVTVVFPKGTVLDPANPDQQLAIREIITGLAGRREIEFRESDA